MKNKAPRQNAHLHNKNPSPACKGTGHPKGGRRDENPALIPLDPKYLPISIVEKTAEKTKKNPSPACGRGVGVRAFVRRTNPAFTPPGEASVYPAWCVANLKFCTEKSLPPLAGEGGRRPERGIKNQDLSRLAGPATAPLGETSNYAAWRAQQLRRLANPATTPLGGPRNYTAWRTQQPRRLARPVFIPLGALPISNFARKNPFPRLRGKVAEGRKGG